MSVTWEGFNGFFNCVYEWCVTKGEFIKCNLILGVALNKPKNKLLAHW